MNMAPVGGATIRPRAPYLTANLLNSCKLLEVTRQVYDMQKDKKISHTYIRDGVYYYERR